MDAYGISKAYRDLDELSKAYGLRSYTKDALADVADSARRGAAMGREEGTSAAIKYQGRRLGLLRALAESQAKIQVGAAKEVPGAFRREGGRLKRIVTQR